MAQSTKNTFKGVWGDDKDQAPTTGGRGSHHVRSKASIKVLLVEISYRNSPAFSAEGALFIRETTCLMHAFARESTDRKWHMSSVEQRLVWRRSLKLVPTKPTTAVPMRFRDEGNQSTISI